VTALYREHALGLISAPAVGVITANRFVALPWSPDLSLVSVAW